MCRNFNNNDKNSSMTPLKDHEKSIPSHKRQRQQQQPRGVKSSHVEDAALFDLFVLHDDEDGEDEEEEEYLLQDEEAQLTLEVANLKHTVGRMQSQVTTASTQLKELKALVTALIHHRALHKQRELKKRRVDA